MEKEVQNAPLIHVSEQDRAIAHNDTLQNNKVERTEIFQEIKNQLWLAVPLISVSLLNFCIQIISVMFVGHLGQLSLSGASIAASFATVTGYSLLQGMACALDTLCGQSYGAKQHSMLGIHTQRAMLVLMIVCIPITIIWAETRSILVLLGQDSEISAEAGKYAQLLVPGLFAQGLLQCLNRFLQTQNIVFPMLFSSGATTLLHLLVCWVMVFKFGLGSRGAALANSLSQWVNVLILTLYVKFSPSCARTWTGFSRAALYNIPSFLHLAIPSAAMVCLERWLFQMVILLSGLLPNPQLETSVLSICMNTAGAVWMIPFGLGAAVSTRVSNELGAGRPWSARLAVRVVSVMAIIESSLVGIVLILIRNIWGYAYSDELQVVKYVASMLPLVAVSSFTDALMSVLTGIARGSGWQKIGAFISLGSHIVGIPSGVVFAFVLSLGGKGLWLGIICGLVVEVICLLIITLRTNWEEEAKKATDRVHGSIIPENKVLEDGVPYSTTHV
ncbi:hypothetical protein VNO78_09142 [Psophocarpus tetragonolobus]|uniref:Protein DETOXIFICATION n=1 Tax=Psophocarpus tetragonolobus TaxID=3891 RepID=A0AAN9SYZ2_PSOTE